MTLLHFGDVRNDRPDPADSLISHVKRLGCVQYDPLNIVGRNPDLVMQSRIPGYKPEYFHTALYTRRELFEGYDKNLAIYPSEDFPAFARTRRDTMANFRSNPEIREMLETVLSDVEKMGEVSSDDLPYDKKVRWAWSDTRLARAALETLWVEGKLALSRRDGSRRYFDLISRCLPENLINSPDPNPTDEEYNAWQYHRRIRSVGLLPSGPSDALLGLDMKAPARKAALNALLESGKILPVEITDKNLTLYMSALDTPVMERAMSGEEISGMRVIAPLDNFMWDRKLIEKLFDFRYRWEVYTPKSKREFGYYVLPLLMNSRFAGRIEFENFRGGTLEVKNIWWESEPEMSALEKCLDDFCAYLGADGWKIS